MYPHVNPIRSLRLPVLLCCSILLVGTNPYAQRTVSPAFHWATTDTTSVEYFLEWGTSPAFTTVVGNSGWIASTQYTVSNLVSGQRYYYHVKARNSARLESLWSEVVSAAHDAVPPDSRVLSLPAEIRRQTFQLRCQAVDTVSGIGQVWLFYRHESMGPYMQWPTPFTPGTWLVTFTAGEGPGLYEFYSLARDRAGNWEPLPVLTTGGGSLVPDAQTIVTLPSQPSLPPVISCIPDIIISDAEQNRPADQNLFVFSNAINLDEYVRDDDTTKGELRWSFVETAPGNSIRINGIGSLPVPTDVNINNPDAYNLRAATSWASFRNNLWSPVTGSAPYPNPPLARMASTLQLYVSDGSQYSSQFIDVTTVDTGAGAATDPNAQKDARVPQAAKSWPFTSGAENWFWFDLAPGYPAPTHQWAAGRLELTESSHGPRPVTFGSWESPKDPTVPGAVKSRFGCVLRARYRLASSVTGMNCPGLRMRAYWTRVTQNPTRGWEVDFRSSDLNDLYEQVYSTLNVMFVAGREPGAGKTYTLLYYPQQIDTLMTTQAITYVTCDLLDDDYPNNDAGTIFIDQVDVDGFARPELGAAGLTPVAPLSFTNFSAWERFQKKLHTSASTATLTQSAGSGGITISCGAGTSLWEAGYASPGAGTPLVDGRYYRSLWRVSSSQGASGDAAPTLRTGYISSKFVWAAQKQLDGGGANSALSPAGDDYEMWVAAPSNLPGSSQTEPVKLRFETYVLFQPNLHGKNISGSLGCKSVTTEWMPALP